MSFSTVFDYPIPYTYGIFTCIWLIFWYHPPHNKSWVWPGFFQSKRLSEASLLASILSHEKTVILITHRIHGMIVCLPTWMVDFYDTWREIWYTWILWLMVYYNPNHHLRIWPDAWGIVVVQTLFYFPSYWLVHKDPYYMLYYNSHWTGQYYDRCIIWLIFMIHV